MIMRIATYPVRKDRNIDEWLEENARRIRSAPGVHSVEFIKSIDPPGDYVGAILRFESRDALEAYRSSDTYRDVVQDLGENWIDSSRDVRQGHYEALEV